MPERAARDRSTGESADHLVALPSASGEWSAWRWAAFRAAGFPASLVLCLADAKLAAAADRVLDAEEEARRTKELAIQAIRRVRTESSTELEVQLKKAMKVAVKGGAPVDTGTAADAEIATLRQALASAKDAAAEFPDAFATAEQRLAQVTHDLASNVLLREAVTWQNRAAFQLVFASLLKPDPIAAPGRARRKQEFVANYLQRYCAKNDTIGFFGPVGWARLTPRETGIGATPGPTLLAQRSVHFEQWAIDELAKKIASDSRVEPWMSPRRHSFVSLEGTAARSAVNGNHELTAVQAAALAQCDGVQTARALALHLTSTRSDVSGESEVFEALRALREKLLIAWTLELPLCWNPDAKLRLLLDRIGNDALRAETMSHIDELDQARTRVAQAAGDAEALGSALSDLEVTFTRLTSSAATRNAGSMYAGRGLVFEDCRRDIDVTIGGDVLAAIGPALSLILTGARWFTFETARVYRERFHAVHADVLRRKGKVTFEDLWFRAQRLLFGDKDKPFASVTGEVERRWSELLPFAPGARRVAFDSAALAPRVRELFAAAGPGWRNARQHTPDLMIAASSLQAIRRGEYEVVLGEIHVAANTLDSAACNAQHPCPDELLTAHGRDLPEACVLALPPKDWPKITTRTHRAFVLPWHYFLQTGLDPAPGPPDRVLTLSMLSIEEVGVDLFVCGPNGFRLELIEFMGEMLSYLTISSFRILPRGDHTPRITIDRLIVARETWRLLPSTMGFAFESTPEGRFLAARRWARTLGLPRFVFAKSTIEMKPVYVDLDSHVFVNMFARLVRNAKEHVAGEAPITLSEMVPGLHETWVTDAAGERYTAELRIVAVDPT